MASFAKFVVCAVGFFAAMAAADPNPTQSPSDRAWNNRNRDSCQSNPQKQPGLPAFPEGTRIRVECPDGYIFVATSGISSYNSNDQYVTCQNSDWSSNLGTCKPTGAANNGNNNGGDRRQSCRMPDTPARASIVSPLDVPATGRFVAENTEIIYACIDGQDPTGPSSIRCRNGQWNPNQMPYCPPTVRDRSCAKPDLPIGLVIANGVRARYQDGQSITFRCSSGYLNGARSIACQNGHWSDDLPVCLANN